MENSREFSLGQLLNITSGRLFTTMDDIYDTMSYLSGDNLNTLGLLEYRKPVSDYILSVYPELTGVGLDYSRDKESVVQYLERQKQLFGDSFRLSPMINSKTK